MKAAYLLLLLPLCGCNSESLETANFGLSYFKNKYQLINATDHEVSFHIANFDLHGHERDPASSKYHYKTLLAGNPAETISHEVNVEERISAYVVATGKSLSAKTTLKVKRDRRYHFLAWQGDGPLDVRVFPMERMDVNSEFSLRIFAADALSLKVDGKDYSLSRGELKGRFILQNCAGTIEVNNIAVDVCDGSLGSSYLLVIDKLGRRGLYQEL
ncbi:hypothetical protein [Shewanella sp.]|uniref:hypothetical protein n=1 Tax=Shewanella sp. TaxID=50422 RepID=UPI003563CD61